MWLVCVELSLIVGFAVFPGVYKYEQAHHTINHLHQPALSVAALISACAKTSGAQRQRRDAARRMTGWSEIILFIGYECIYKIKQLLFRKRELQNSKTRLETFLRMEKNFKPLNPLY